MSEPESAAAIVAMALRVPGAESPAEFWDGILGGRVSLPAASDAPRADGRFSFGRFARTTEFDEELFGMSPLQAAITDPQHRVLTELVWEALEQGGYDPARFPGTVGVFVGSGQERYRRQVEDDPALVRAAGGRQIQLGNDRDFLATALSYRLGLTGPSLTVQAACATSLVAVHLAVRSLLTYECDLAVAGAVSVQLPLDAGYVHEGGTIVSPDGRCRPFTRGSSGTVPASGGAVVVLRRAGEAREAGDRLHALVVGSATNNDGPHRMSLTAPSPRGQAAVIREALEVSGHTAGQVAFVETHGTGTSLGDHVELAALAETYGGAAPGRCALGAVKANIGHTDTAAGAIGLVKAVLALEHGVIPPTPAQPGDGPDADLGSDRLYVPREAAAWPAEHTERRPDDPTGDRSRLAAVSSFGLGGANTHVILAQAPAPAPAPPRAAPPGPHLLVLSAATGPALTARARDLAAVLRAEGPGSAPETPAALEAPADPADPVDLAGTLWHRRRHLAHRWVYVLPDGSAVSRAALADALTALPAPGAGPAAGEPPLTAVLLPGQGRGLRGAGGRLAAADPRYRAEAAALTESVLAADGPDLRDAWDWPDGDPRLLDTAVVQPLLYVLETALLRTLAVRGIRPGLLLGHSVGELVAAAHAGVFAPEDAAAAVVRRGRFMSRAAPGAMLAVRTAAEQVARLAESVGKSVGRGAPGVEISAVNGLSETVVGGPEGAVAAFRDACAAAGLVTRPLVTAHAFHTRAMAEAGRAFEDYLRGVTLHTPDLTVFSNVTGEVLSGGQATDPAYWSRQLTGTVRFHDGLRRLLEERPGIVLEAGPGTFLSGLARQAARTAGSGSGPEPGARDAGAVSAGPVVAAVMGAEPRTEAHAYLGALGAAWGRGVAVDPPIAPPGTVVPLPRYPFASHVHWAGPVPRTEPVDRPGSPAPEQTVPAAVPTGSVPEPQAGTAAETTVRIWRESFGGPPLKDSDNFFALGGSSLQAAQLISTVNDSLLLSVRLHDLYEHPTLGAFTERVAQALDDRDDEELARLIDELDALDEPGPEDAGRPAGRDGATHP